MNSQSWLLHNVKKYKYYLLLLLSIIPWVFIYLTPFVNDDYQILGYHNIQSFSDVFKPFYQKDVSTVYWRPLSNVLHTLWLYLFGMNHYVHRFAGFIWLYTSLVVIFRVTVFIGISKKTSFLLTMLFTLVPSHEYTVAWIAITIEPLMFTFILLSFVFYCKSLLKREKQKRYVVGSILFMVAALLMKEQAIVCAAGPLLAFVLLAKNKSIQFRRILRDLMLFSAIVAMFFVIPILFIGTNPFLSGHITKSSVLKPLINYLLYVPMSIVSPEVLEIGMSGLKTPAGCVVALFSITALTFLVMQLRLTRLKVNKQKIAFSLLWYTVFILPGLPTFMRWYSYTASIGLFWLVAFALDPVVLNKTHTKKVLAVFIVVAVTLGLFDWYRSFRWFKNGNRLDASIRQLSSERYKIQRDTVYCWGVPEKDHQVPLMKLGFQQTVEYALQRKNIDVCSPLRAEYYSDKAVMQITAQSDSTMVFKLQGGRFKMIKNKSEAIPRAEQLEYRDSVVSITVETKKEKGNKLTSVAYVWLVPGIRGFNHIYYSGRKFEVIR